MKGFINKERFVEVGCDMSVVEDEMMRIKFNNDLLFYKWMLDQGITEFTGGVREAFEITWDFHRHLFDRKEAGVATDLELKALEQFELFIGNYIDDDEAGD